VILKTALARRNHDYVDAVVLVDERGAGTYRGKASL
jgi:hypothetical protein